MTAPTPTPPSLPAPPAPPIGPGAQLLEEVAAALEPAFRLALVAAAPERVVYQAWDRLLKRYVALHVHLELDSSRRAGSPGGRRRRTGTRLLRRRAPRVLCPHRPGTRRRSCAPHAAAPAAARGPCGARARLVAGAADCAGRPVLHGHRDARRLRE